MLDDDTIINEKLNRVTSTKATLNELRREKLEIYIHFGREHARMAKQIPSTKEFGKALKKRFPASEMMDAALRSNCGWLAEALDNPNHEAHDILHVLGVGSINDLNCENPTTIRRLYRRAKKGGK